MENHGSHHDEHPWWIAAIIASTTGLCLSIFISAIVGIGVYLRFQPIVALERVGIEEGMRLYAAFSSYLPEPEVEGPSFVYIDVDVAGCEKLSTARPFSCRTSNPVTPQITAASIQWAQRSGAKGVIIDRAPFSQGNWQTPDQSGRNADRTREQILDAALMGPAWVIAPLAGRTEVVDGGIVFNRNLEDDLIETPAKGQLRLASFEAIDGDQAQDGKFRFYRTDEPTRSQVDGPLWQAPTVGYLAAALWREGLGAETDCHYYGQGCLVGHEIEKRETQSLPIGFSLPSLSILERQTRIAGRIDRDTAGLPAAGDEYDSKSAQFERQLTRLKFSQLVDQRGIMVPPDQRSVAGRIVIIGSSEPTALDQVFTPVGLMSGSEFLMNSIRSIALGMSIPSAEHESIWSAFVEKTMAALRGAMVMTIAWLMIFAVWRRSRARSLHARLIAHVTVSTIFLVGMTSVALVEGTQLAKDAAKGLFQGHFVDILTPMIALGLEGYSEAISLVVQNIERSLSKAIHAVGQWTQQLFEKGSPHE